MILFSLKPKLNTKITLNHPPFTTTRVGCSRGTREPGSHEIFRLTRNFCCNSHCFVANLTSRYFCISCQMKKFFLSHTKFRKYFLITGRNILALKIIFCHRNKFLVTERNLLLRTKFLLTERNFLSMNEISCHRKKFLVSK